MDSIIFDLDGTLWDPRETVLASWNKALKNRGMDVELTTEDLTKTMGLQLHEIAQVLFPDLNEQEQIKLMKECSAVEIPYVADNGGELYPHLEQTLKALSQKYRLFIVSNCQEGYIEAFYHYHKLDHYFSDFENPGRTGLSKGENINLVIKRNQLESPIYVGDTQGDRNAARHAGIPFIFAKYGFGNVDDSDDVIEGLDDLVKKFG
ncbi:HAD family hydrolase [Jeotgalibacillus proteolyticus]|uniref:HAD family hydrolase n=1 Tax=Jeotgalibacillus proteolyticus TaxID=2082395 RepID=A0A2S5GDB6_9BACL|nr:HAD family hydrolase [Jeotgalibacillus proteolyticus]PPA71032.1 HAD family hydrolase [Jeotgalibacillus proteolyticus]